jgi:hypothetical protein
MTETTARIRWESEPEASSAACAGYAGTFGRDLFRIYAPDESDDRWILASLLPGSDHRSAYGESAEELKPVAERLLAEFVVSLGAIFPEKPGSVLADVSDAEAYAEDFRARHAPGRRVRFSRPGAGYPADQEMAARVLTPGEVYTIEWSDIGFSSSRLGLAGVESGLGFNSVLFEPVTDEEAAATAGEETSNAQ